MVIPQRRGDPIVIDADEGIRADSTAEALGSLRPAFDPNGTITARNASQISDGAAALVVMSREKAEAEGTVKFDVPADVSGQYIVVWFTGLTTDDEGKRRAWLNEVVVTG